MTPDEQEFRERLAANVEKHKPLMDRLAREGDCLACVGVDGGCDAHRIQPFAMPDRIAVDAKGYGWRVWDDDSLWSMVPTNPDNSPIPTPVTWFVPASETADLIASQAAEIERLTAERVSTLSVGGVQLTWEEAAAHYREAADVARRYQSILFDLDRCEHGRHEGDVCSSCGGPSLGNSQLDRTRIVKGRHSLLPKRCIGFDINARPIVVPMRHDPHTPEAWIATEDTP